MLCANSLHPRLVSPYVSVCLCMCTRRLHDSAYSAQFDAPTSLRCTHFFVHTGLPHINQKAIAMGHMHPVARTFSLCDMEAHVAAQSSSHSALQNMSHQEPPGATRRHQEPPEATRSHQKPPLIVDPNHKDSLMVDPHKNVFPYCGSIQQGIPCC